MHLLPFGVGRLLWFNYPVNLAKSLTHVREGCPVMPQNRKWRQRFHCLRRSPCPYPIPYYVLRVRGGCMCSSTGMHENPQPWVSGYLLLHLLVPSFCATEGFLRLVCCVVLRCIAQFEPSLLTCLSRAFPKSFVGSSSTSSLSVGVIKIFALFLHIATPHFMLLQSVFLRNWLKNSFQLKRED